MSVLSSGLRREGSMLRGWSAVTAVVCALVVYGWGVCCSAWAGFGVVPGSFSTVALNRDGSVDLQAGSHPYEYRVSFKLNTKVNAQHNEEAEGYLRGVEVALPAGLVGDPSALPRCSRTDFEGLATGCPGETQIGILNALVELEGKPNEIATPVYDLVPPPGVVASFGFSATSLNGFEEASVRTGAGYGVLESVENAPAQVIAVSETIWGVPSEASHDKERLCFQGTLKTRVEGCASEAPARPVLRLPTSCTGPLTASIRVLSREGQEASVQSVSQDEAGEPAGLVGCDGLGFEPSLSVRPDTSVGEAPSGLTTELKLAQSESVGTLAHSDLKEAVVTLPAGMTVNPSAANGLGACPLTGPSGIDLTSGEGAGCPASSKLGTVEVVTPLLERPLTGSVFLAQQGDLTGFGENPFGSLLAMYVVAEGEGVVAKIPGEIELDETTGQLTARFGGVKDSVTGEEYLPQLPFSSLKMTFFGGPRAPLTTPSECGSYAAKARFVAWSSTPEHPVISEPAVTPFTIDENCATHSFNPSFQAGTTNPQAGAYTPFVTVLARQDGEQHLQSFQETLPPGLLANIASVPLCGDSEAQAGACPESSRIGTVAVKTGTGSEPLTVNGAIYLTSGYAGGQFGETVEVPAIAGPFNLNQNNGARPIVVRGAIHVNATTAQATVVSDPFPQWIPGSGVPADVREVHVTLDRPGFTFNPTNCAPMSIQAVIGSTAGATVDPAAPFQAADCAALPSKPSFTVSTQGGASKAYGASLTVTVTEKPGQEANIPKFDLQLPKQLPARLTTLQQACPASVFEADPAGCDQGSIIGSATIHTPILKGPLTGPAYLVSHGGAAFPDVEFVLQGEDNITLLLDGKTDIKNGITYSKFETTPDAPFTTFETTLPTGPHSALTANVAESKHYSLCGETLEMPTRIIAQNGALTEQNTKVAITGCSGVQAAKAKKLTRAQLLAAALKQCRTKYKHAKHKRIACERTARKRYAAHTATTHHKHGKTASTHHGHHAR